MSFHSRYSIAYLVMRRSFFDQLFHRRCVFIIRSGGAYVFLRLAD